MASEDTENRSDSTSAKSSNSRKKTAAKKTAKKASKKKTAKKAASKKKAAKKKVAKKKATQKKTASKKTTAKKAASKKKTTKKTAKKKTAQKKASSKKASGKKATARKTRSTSFAKRFHNRMKRVKSGLGRWAKRLWRPMLAISLLGILVLGAYTVHLSAQVRATFDGKRWSVPAQVYARPLELYLGAHLTPAQLNYELSILGYRKVAATERSGQWSQAGERFVVRSRDFAYWDGAQQGDYLEVILRNDAVVRLRSLRNGQELDLLRLEPAVIGSIYPQHREDRVLVRGDQIPEHLVQALLAVEDRRFFDHWGVDPRGIGRAMVTNLRAGSVVQGGSTLTQQLVKNFFLSSERTLLRKLNEALMALILEARYSKAEILEAYANEIFLGQDGARAIHGFGLAAYYYFNRPLNELQVHETALLAGIVKGASYYNPRRRADRALKRRNLVLQQMQTLGFISAEQSKRSQALGLGVSAKGKSGGHRYPAFVQLVRAQLKRDYRDQDLTSEGLRIFTTLDPWDQHNAAKGVAGQLGAIERQRGIKANSLQAAMVIASPSEGEIRALIGGRNATGSGFNRALNARRPIGSLVKPAVYLSALTRSRDYTLSTLLRDTAVSIKLRNGDVWQPRNYDRKEHGAVALQSALADSLNLATVNLGMDLGLARVVATLKGLGAPDSIKPYPSLLLGASTLSPLQVTQLYQTLANGGYRAELRAIREVTDARNKPLQRYPLDVAKAADPRATWLLTHAMTEVIRSGTGKGLKRYLPGDYAVAGKTGTTNDLRDSWFAGFGSDRVSVVWVGRDDNAPTGLTGSSGALPVFGAVMQSLQMQPLDRQAPQGIGLFWTALTQNRLSASDCPGALVVPFVEGTQPQHYEACAQPQGVQGFLQNFLE